MLVGEVSYRVSYREAYWNEERAGRDANEREEKMIRTFNAKRRNAAETEAARRADEDAHAEVRRADNSHNLDSATAHIVNRCSGVSFVDWLSEYNLSARFVGLSS